MLDMRLFELLALALVAGGVSFTAPCTLPLLPGYVSYVSGLDARPRGGPSHRARLSPALAGSALFVLGFSTVFVLLGLTASSISALLLRNGEWLRYVAGTTVILMGLVSAGLLKVPLLRRQGRLALWSPRPGLGGAAPLGAAFALGWTPCIGPVLAGLLAVAASTSGLGQGALLLAAYSLGLGLPFLGLAVAVARGKGRLHWLRRHSRGLEVLGGLLLVLMGIFVLSGSWTRLMGRMLGLYAQVGWPPI